ncbi:MAG: arsenate reductase [Erythrobacter sp.]
MIHLYGIPSCDTVRKARKWLGEQGLDHSFHDFKDEGVEREALERWVDEVSWEVLFNRRSTTFRKLDDAEKSDLSRTKAIALMMEHPSLIKRPVLTRDDSARVLIGFTRSEWENELC